MIEGAARSYRAWLHDKRSVIEEHLKEFSPTVVVRRPEGIYIFADSVAKVHTTIVLAGAGRAFASVSDWFRKEIADLALAWSPREPRAEVEARLMQQVFYQNLNVSRDIVLADVVVIEVAPSEENDFVARVDFSGKMRRFRKEQAVIVSYCSVKEDVEANGGANTSTEDLAGLRRSAEDDYRKSLRDEFARLSINLPEDTGNSSQCEVFLRDLKERYAGAKCFLSRERVRKKEYHWVFGSL